MQISFDYNKHYAVAVVTESATLEGDLSIPLEPQGLVLFAHGSGSSRHSPRNKYVATVLQENHFATLLLDLLTVDEELLDQQTSELRFNIPFLAKRLCNATDWIKAQALIKDLPLGYFGASTGSAAALVAASYRPEHVQAIVSRGGRPDLAEDYLSQIKAPTLLIVGSNDTVVLDLNQRAFIQLAARKQLAIIPYATHLFEEPGTLEQVAQHAAEWFKTHLLVGK